MNKNILFLNNYKVAIYIILAFMFSVGIRLIWVYQFAGESSFYWNGQLMINTNDGYVFADASKDVLAGNYEKLNPITQGIALVTAFFATILPFSFESIILFLPTFLGSLIVVPIILLGKNLKNAELGFAAALLASIAWSYYNRTMTGYYDTDMLNIVLPTFLIYALILAIDSREDKYLFMSSMVAIIYIWWYPQSTALTFSLVGIILLYTLLFKRSCEYLIWLCSLLIVAVMNFEIEIKLMLSIALFLVFIKSKQIKKIHLGILVLSLIVFILSGGLNPILDLLKIYVIRDSVLNSGSDMFQLHFFSVMQTVTEASSIPFNLFANRISGHVITFFISLVGYVLLCYKRPVVLLTLPMLGLGFLAYKSGLRFTVYAVPILALGVTYLIFFIGEIIEHKWVRYAFIIFSSLLVLLPNVLHVIDYRVPTVFNKEEVRIIDRLKKVANSKDYVVAWWDYGYPLRYYGGIRTLIDGGRHSGDVNFAPSFVLTRSQTEAVNMARLDVEYTERSFRDKNQTVPNIVSMMVDYGFKDANDFLLSLQSDIKLPPKTRDIYLYLPFRMISIFPTVSKFSYIDLMNGKIKNEPFIYKSSLLKREKGIMYFSGGIRFEESKGLIYMGNSKVRLNTFYSVDYNKNGKTVVYAQVAHKDGNVYILYAKAYGSFYIMNETAFNSSYIQLFYLENYDKNLFELVERNPYAKLYRLKK